MRSLGWSVSSLWRAAVCCGALLLFTPVWAQTCSIPGQAGAATITSQPNTFFAGSGSPAAGATSLTVTGPGTGAASDIQAGDLLLIIQMQGADIDYANDRGYGNNTGSGSGTGTNGQTVPYNNNTANYAGGYLAANFFVGTYEWAVASGGGATFGAGGTINLSQGLTNAYYTRANSTTVTKRSWQVVRVPQYSHLVLNAGIAMQPWNGSTGGLLVLEATGDIDLNGQTVSGNGRGYRGGGAVEVAANGDCTNNWNSTNNVCWDYRATIASSRGGSKGEGIAGTPARIYTGDPDGTGAGSVTAGTVDGYPAGEAARGAPGNAGGGGNQHNAGGGGGGNAGAGGMGGNTWNSSTTSSRGLIRGGFGGAPVTNAFNRWMMGGGGGAADVGGNAVTAPSGSGGAGGGIVVIRASRIDGGGATINVDGAPGINTATTDAAGGGGAGGTVVLTANTNIVGGLTINARGGRGGNYTANVAEQDGPGGGGGGGYVMANVSGFTTAVTGGAAGTSASTSCGDCGSDPGSTGAGNGGYAGTAAGVLLGYECLPNLSVTATTTKPLVTESTGGTTQYVVTVTNSGGGARFVTLDHQLPPGWTYGATSDTDYVPVQPLAAARLSSGAETVALTNASPWSVAAQPLSLGGTGTVAAFALAPRLGTTPSSMTLSFVASIPATATVGTYHLPVGVEFIDPTRLTSANTRMVTPLTLATANRTATAYAATAYARYNGAATTNVSGSNYNGLVAGPTGEDVRLIPDFSITKTAPASVTPLVTFSYVITPRNNGRPVAAQVYATTQATDVSLANVPATFGSNPLTVTDTFPGTGVTLTTAFAGTGWTCSGAGTIVCTLANANAWPIANGTDFAPITATAVLTRPCISSTASVTNAVRVSAGVGETVASNNTDTVVVTPPCVNANVTLTKTNGTGTVAAGATVSYTLTVANLGPGNAPGAELEDPAVAGLSCSAVSCNVAAGTAVCPASPSIAALQGAGLVIPTFNANSTLSFRITCNVTATGE